MSGSNLPSRTRHPIAKSESRDLPRLVEGANEFALDLYSRLQSSKHNLFFSPYSISTALSMLFAGARGRTAQQMAEVLRLPMDGRRLHGAVRALREGLGEEEACELSTANSLWGQEGYTFRGAYLELLETAYGAGLFEVDFENARETARRRINKWVSERTRGRIPVLIPPDVLDPTVRLILANAIYFKGEWEIPFPGDLTSESIFRLPGGKEPVPVAMMAQTTSFRFHQEHDLQVLEMPYRGDRLAMLFVLPREPDGLPEVEAALGKGKLKSWIRHLREREVIVSIPRFEMTTGAFLADVLGSMGMNDVFQRSRANLSGITLAERCCLSEVIHRAFVEVNEMGTEAAAATGMLAVASAIDLDPPPVFCADHPFLFLIRDVRSQAILFLGRLVKPVPLDIEAFRREREILEEPFRATPAGEDEESPGRGPGLIAALLQSILEDAQDLGATEVHVEPSLQLTTVRFRVGDKLRDGMAQTAEICPPLVSRFKEACGMNLDICDMPQSGRGVIPITSSSELGVAFEAETSPTNHGERLLLRILPSSPP